MAKIDDEHIYITEPARFLVENVDILPRGRVLDIAMGGGRNAVFLAKKGFEVEGIDVSEGAVEAARELAQKEGVWIKAEVVNLEKDYFILKDAFELIICFNYLQRSLMGRIKEGVKKGGMVVYETYIVDQAAFGRPRNPAHLLKHNELLEIFGDFRCLRYREGIIERHGKTKAIASIVAQKE